jgi:hypothetical protein
MPSTPRNACELGAGRDAERDRERRQLHGPVVDELLQYVVLHLLVGDRNDEQHQRDQAQTHVDPP